MAELYAEAIHHALKGVKMYCKFLSANDTGESGGHQAGFYISKPGVPILFNDEDRGTKGSNYDRWVQIKWQGEIDCPGHFIYYGRGSRNEYRITNTPKIFRSSEYTDALFVLIQDTYEEYEAYVLKEQEDIDCFLEAFDITREETNCMVEMDS